MLPLKWAEEPVQALVCTQEWVALLQVLLLLVIHSDCVVCSSKTVFLSASISSFPVLSCWSIAMFISLTTNCLGYWNFTLRHFLLHCGASYVLISSRPHIGSSLGLSYICKWKSEYLAGIMVILSPPIQDLEHFLLFVCLFFPPFGFSSILYYSSFRSYKCFIGFIFNFILWISIQIICAWSLAILLILCWNGFSFNV